MKKIVLIFVGLLLIVSLLIFTQFQLGSKAPVNLSLNSVTDGQESFVRHLELGLLYEQNDLLDEAENEYKLAAEADQDEIAKLAQASLARVIAHQNNIWLRFQIASNEFLIWLWQNLVRLIVFGLVIWLIWLLIIRFPRRSGYLLLPFEDYTEDKLGRGLHSLVNLVLQEAKQIYSRRQEEPLGGLEKLEFPLFSALPTEHDSISNGFSILDSFSVSGIDLPFGKMMLTIRRWFSTREYIITGDLHQYGKTLRLSAEISKANTGEVMQTWALSMIAEEQLDDQVAILAEELAYRIIFEVCPGLEARNWQSLHRFTTALRESQQNDSSRIEQVALKNAITLLQQALTLDPGYTTAHYVLGNLYSNLGQYLEACDEYGEVVRSGNRLGLEAKYNMGLAFYHLFQEWANEKARKCFLEVQDDLIKSTGAETKLLLLALTHCGLATVYAQQINSISNKGKQENKNDYLSLVQQHCNQALDLSNHEKVAAAAHNALGLAHLKAGQHEAAVEILKTAIQIFPSYPIAYIHLASAYVNTHPDEAIHWLRRALWWWPNYEKAYFELGKFCTQQGDVEAAKEAYLNAPQSFEACNRLGELLAVEEDYEVALANFHKAVELNRRYARAWRNLAWWTVESGQKDELSLRDATIWARKALNLDHAEQSEWLSRDVLGWVLVHRDQLDKAQVELKLSIVLRGDRIRNRYHLAYLYQKRGDPEKARVTLQEALNFKQASDISDWRQRAETLLRKLEQEIG
jgi:tetratricopeptide (TPR) repeat protein